MKKATFLFFGLFFLLIGASVMAQTASDSMKQQKAPRYHIRAVSMASAKELPINSDMQPKDSILQTGLYKTEDAHSEEVLELTLEMAMEMPVKVEVYNMDGTLVYKAVQTGSTPMDLSKMPKGARFVMESDNTKVYIID